MFNQARVVEVFTGLLIQIAKTHDFHLIYCFMPDHLHVISMGQADWSDVLLGIEEFKQISGCWLKTHHVQVRWQRSFYDRIIRVHEMGIYVRYVLDNPVRRGLVGHWREHPFTGAIGMDLETFLQELGPD